MIQMNQMSRCFWYYVMYFLLKSVYLNLMHSKTDLNAIATYSGYSLFLFLYLQNLKYLKWVENVH